MSEATPTLSDGRYQLIEVLGSGGMAVVYRVFDARLQAERALKLLNPALMEKPSMRERFLSEARTMAGMYHPHLMTVHDVGQDQGRIFIVMELVEGGTLWDWVREHGPMPPAMAAGVLIKVLEAIEEAHGRGVIHRDIKPQNVLLTERGRPLLTDFGIARVQDTGYRALTKTGAAIGTQGFMAPEQRKQAKEVDARADIFALGGTLYAMLTAELPMDIYASEVERELYQQLPAPLAAIVRKAARFLPEDRYQDAPSMRRALEEALPQLEPDPEDTPVLGGKRARPPKARLEDFHVPTKDAATVATPASSGGAFPSAAPMSMPSGVATQGGTQPAVVLQRRWLVPVISITAGLLIGGGLWWSGRQQARPALAPAPDTTVATQPASLSAPPVPEPEAPLLADQVEPSDDEAPALEDELGAGPDDDVPTDEPEAAALEEEAVAPARDGDGPVAEEPAAEPPPADVPFPQVRVFVNALPWGRWTLSGDATDAGGQTPFDRKLRAPGTYHFHLQDESGRSHDITVTLDGTQETLARCWDFAAGWPCPSLD